MIYEVVLLPLAEQDIRALPLPLQNYVEEQLNRLASQPASLSRPSAFPFPPNCQLFQPDPVQLDDEVHYFTVIFQYAQDETTLRILGIGHTRS